MKSATKNRRKSRRMFLESLEDRRLLQLRPIRLTYRHWAAPTGFAWMA